MSYVELFDVACLLSRWEGFGLALPEYMMAGKPIVASRVDAMEEFEAVKKKFDAEILAGTHNGVSTVVVTIPYKLGFANYACS